MTVQTASTETVAFRVPANLVSISGSEASQRTIAFSQIAPNSFIENMSRVDSIANLRVALGKRPSEGQIAVAQTEWVIGRVASRLPASERPKEIADDADLLDFARTLVTLYSAPTEPGKKARALPKGKTGRRSVVQHKVCRAADEAWSMVKAELGFGNAKTQKTKNKGRVSRSTNLNPVRGDGKSDILPPVAPVELSDKLRTVGDVCRVVEGAAATLLQIAGKHAKLLPTDYGSAIQAFKTAINKATNARGEREAAASK